MDIVSFQVQSDRVNAGRAFVLFDGEGPRGLMDTNSVVVAVCRLDGESEERARETELQYQGLGAALQPVRLANYRRLVHELRVCSPSVPYDGRLATTSGKANILGGILPPDQFLDVALALLAAYHRMPVRLVPRSSG